MTRIAGKEAREREKTKKLNESLDIQEKTLAAEEKEFSNMLKSAVKTSHNKTKHGFEGKGCD